MIKNNIEKFIEHTLLKPNATIDQIEKLLKEALEFNMLGVCINPVYVSYAKDFLKSSDCKIITVIGFPLGANTTDTKVFESVNAVKNGAKELDMVINIAYIKDKKYSLAEQEIKKIVKEVEKIPLKVIIETDLLNKQEIIDACKICANAGASFVKTSTGFVANGVGATEENIKLMYETVSPFGLQVKASGGIKNKASLIKMVNAGASRIGTSAGTNILKEI